ncbi:MAG: DUF3102 domain-containing protein [Candidatus Paceibacterota bacterium]
MKRTKFSRNKSHSYYEDLGQSEKFQITRIEHNIQSCIINIKKDSFEIGKLLHQAKSILPHGSFEQWIKKTFGDDLPYSTAYLYMRIYETFKHRAGIIQNIPIKHLVFLTQKKLPEEVLQMIKEKLDEDPEGLVQTGLTDVKEMFDLMKKGTIGGSQFLKEVKQIIKEGQKLEENRLKNRNKHRMNTNARRTLYFGLGDILERLDAAIKQARKMAGLFPFDPEDPEHQKIIKHIGQIRKKLQRLEIELQGGEGLFKPVSTKNGTEYL